MNSSQTLETTGLEGLSEALNNLKSEVVGTEDEFFGDIDLEKGVQTVQLSDYPFWGDLNVSFGVNKLETEQQTFEVTNAKIIGKNYQINIPVDHRLDLNNLLETYQNLFNKITKKAAFICKNGKNMLSSFDKGQFTFGGVSFDPESGVFNLENIEIEDSFTQELERGKYLEKLASEMLIRYGTFKSFNS